MVDEILLQLSPELIGKIDILVENKRYKNRVDVVRTAVIEFLSGLDNAEKVNANIICAIDSGQFDEILEVRVRRIISDIIGRE